MLEFWPHGRYTSSWIYPGREFIFMQSTPSSKVYIIHTENTMKAKVISSSSLSRNVNACILIRYVERTAFAAHVHQSLEEMWTDQSVQIQNTKQQTTQWQYKHVARFMFWTFFMYIFNVPYKEEASLRSPVDIMVEENKLLSTDYHSVTLATTRIRQIEWFGILVFWQWSALHRIFLYCKPRFKF